MVFFGKPIFCFIQFNLLACDMLHTVQHPLLHVSPCLICGYLDYDCLWFWLERGNQTQLFFDACHVFLIRKDCHEIVACSPSNTLCLLRIIRCVICTPPTLTRIESTKPRKGFCLFLVRVPKWANNFAHVRDSKPFSDICEELCSEYIGNGYWSCKLRNSL